jgi:hypothetical protein
MTYYLHNNTSNINNEHNNQVTFITSSLSRTSHLTRFINLLSLIIHLFSRNLFASSFSALNIARRSKAYFARHTIF